MRSRIRLVLAAIVVFYATWSTAFWGNTRKALSSDGRTYEQRRIEYGFDGLPLDQVVVGVNSVLPLEIRIALSEAAKIPYEQRYTEAFYPRVVDRRSPVVLDVVDSHSFRAKGQDIAVASKSNKVFVIRNRPPELVPRIEPVNETESFSLSWPSFVVSLLAGMGLGMLLSLCLSRRFFEFALWPMASVMSGAVVAAVLVTCGTWTQIALSWRILRLFGVSIFILFVIFFFLKKIDLKNQISWYLRAARSPENWIFLILGLFFLIRMAEFPVTMWDGRSVWLFHTKQVFFGGMFSKPDLLQPDSQWSHPEYPLLFPAWLSLFSFSNIYDERMASLGIPVLLWSVLSLVWYLARLKVGRWPGAAVTLAGFFAVETMTAGGYVDGILMFLIFLEFLALGTSPCQWVGWVAAAAAALLKFEGLVLAGTVASIYLIFWWRSHRESSIRAVAPLVAVVPGVLHFAWTKAIGLKGAYPILHRVDSLHDFLWRSRAIFKGIVEIIVTGGSMRVHPILWEGLAGTVVFLVCRALVKSRDASAMIAFYSSCVLVGFTYLVMLFTPYDLRAHVYSAADRLLFHPALLLLFAPFLILRNVSHDLNGRQTPAKSVASRQKEILDKEGRF